MIQNKDPEKKHMRTKPSPTRSLILSKAAFAFYENGYHATGVDRVAKEAGVTKATLYHYFRSKDALVEESLRFLSEEFKRRCFVCWQQPHLSAKEKLTSLFDTFEDFFKDKSCFGCPFINAAAEYSEPSHTVRQICADHFRFVEENLTRFAQEAGLKAPIQIARHILTIIMGAFCAWQAAKLSQAAADGKALAHMVIANAS